ncbi:MAG: super-infection exclusion protein B [Carnobacterium sp.]|uniref:super-infection exclusion protein B n=1 Tax=Carnobacterium TaxID=2747 RepID=UPI0012FC3A4D|nr:super-infection exclusion protein B [Carnobacterium maltaromaticum]
MGTIDKAIDFLNNPLNKGVLWAGGIISFILLLCNVLLSSDNLKLLFIDSLLDKYGWTLPLIFLFCIVFLIVGFVSGKIKQKEDKKFEDHMNTTREDLFTDKDALLYLNRLFKNHPNPCKLPQLNQKVKLLEQYGLIAKASNQILVYSQDEIENPYFPYILQPIAEKRLKKMQN